ncbi:NAD(P)-binding protein, partial [bacterium]|nr:NAD(P)-binding protein [bacterium]
MEASIETSTFDVLIVGGGLAGLALACALRDTRLKIALVEGHARPSTRTPSAGVATVAHIDSWDARVYAISPANVDFLKAIGVWKHLDAERMAPIHAM